MKTFRNFVNGSFVDAKSGETTNVINPATGQVYAQAVLSREADVDLAMRAAEHGAELWRDATPGERSLALYRMADAVESRAEEIIALEVENTGKPIAITRSEEIPPMVDQMRFFAGAAEQHGKTAAPPANARPSPRVAGRTQPPIHAAGGEKSPPARGRTDVKPVARAAL